MNVQPAESPTTSVVAPDAKVVNLADGETFVRLSLNHPGAPTLLLLHGWLATADLNWFGCYGPLAQRWNFVAPDHRGHGRGLRTPRPFSLEAAADDAAQTLDALGVSGPVVAVGYSMGGPIALHLARRHPGRVEALVLTATALDFRHRWRNRILWHGLGAVSAGLRLDGERRVVERFVDELAVHDDLVAAWRPRLLGESTRIEVRAAMQAGRAIGRFDAKPWAAELALPAAVLVTRRDRAVSPVSQELLAHTLNARVFDIEADHDVVLRQPGLFADTLRAVVSAVLDRTAVAPARPFTRVAAQRVRDRFNLRRGR